MNHFWRNITSNLKTGYQRVSEKTGEITRVGRLKLEILSVKHEIERLLLELGGRVYQMMKEKDAPIKLSQHLLQEIVDRILPLEERLTFLKSEIERIKKESGGFE